MIDNTQKQDAQEISANFVATNLIQSKTCDFCNLPVFPSKKNPTLLDGFRDLDTKMFVGWNCYKEYYKAKHAGKFGKEHAGKYSEYPEDVPQAEFTNKSKLITKKNVATKSDFRFLPEKGLTHNIFEVGDIVIADTNGKDNKYSKFGWENKPVYDKVIGFEKIGNGFHYLTEESPKGIHPSRLFPAEKANRIQLFGIDFIHHEPCELLTPGGIYYIRFLSDKTEFEYNKAIGITFKNFRLSVMVNEKLIIEDLDYFAHTKVEEAIWMMLKNGFTILHWKNNPPVHKNILKRKSTQNVATKQIEPETTKIDPEEIPVKFIGQFGYNENDVLVQGAIVTVEIKTSKIYAKAEIGQTSHGWSLATKNESKFYHDGSGNSSYLVSLDSRYQFKSQEEAKIASFYHLKRSLEYELKNAPEQASKAYKKEIDKLNSLIGDLPEPKGFDILAKPEKTVKEPTKNKKTKVGQPRTEMLKLRCSKEFKELLHEMSNLTDDSIADIIHKAVKCFPKTDTRLHTKIDYKRLDEII